MKLHSAQELVARIVHLSTRDGKPIPITWGGTMAYTDSKSVNLPALPSGTILTPHEFSVLLGYTFHEAGGHLIHTDFPTYLRACKTHNDPVFSYLLNIFEDIRIENLDITRYPGDRKYLDTTHQFVDDQIPPDDCRNPTTISLIYKEAFVKYRNLDTKRITGNLEGPIVEAMKPLAQCRSTHDCVQLAEVIRKLIKKESQQTKPQQGESQRRDNNNGNDYNPQNNAKYNDSKENPSNNQDSRNSPTSSNDIASKDAQKWQELTEIKNLLEKLLKDVEHTNNPLPPPHQADLTGKSIFPPKNPALDNIYIPSEEDLDKYQKARAQLAPQIMALKKMFRIFLQARSKKSWLRGLDEGETLDRERLHVIAAHQTTVFKNRRERSLIDTALELMLDLSGSMNEHLLRSAAITLAEALDTIPQIKLSIAGFTTNREWRSRSIWDEIPCNSGRHEGMDIKLFKDYTEPYAKCRAKLGAIVTRNQTPLGDAYGKALERIIHRPEPRRIIFLVTDGRPEFIHGTNHSDYLLMANIHQRAKRLNIETFGLGIIGRIDAVSYLAQYTDKCTIIKSIETLPQDIMRMLRETIR